MRSDFQFMKEIASYTHVDANSRYNRLRQFAADIHQSTECQDELAKWNIKLDVDLVKFEARVLDAEHILYFDVNLFSHFHLYIFMSVCCFSSVLLDIILMKQVILKF